MDKDDIRREYEDLKRQFKGTSLEDFKAGDWLANFARWMLEQYARNVDAAYIRRMYPGAGTDEQSKKAIALAGQYAGIAGGLSATAVTALELSIPSTGGLDAIVAVPAIGGSIMADVGFSTRLQLRSTYDLSVIHAAPLSTDDVEDCYLIFSLALNMKLGEAAKDIVKAVGPAILKYNVRRLLRTGLRKALIEILRRLIGPIARKLTEKALMRILVPGLSIPLSVWMNRRFTKAVLAQANVHMRRRGAVIRPLMEIFRAQPDFPKDLVVKSLIVLAQSGNPADGWAEEQMNALRYSQKLLCCTDDEIAALEGWFERSVQQIIESLPRLGEPAAKALVQYLTVCAALNDEASHDMAYARTIAALAQVCRVPFDPTTVAAERQRLVL